MTIEVENPFEACVCVCVFGCIKIIGDCELTSNSVRFCHESETDDVVPVNCLSKKGKKSET